MPELFPGYHIIQRFIGLPTGNYKNVWRRQAIPAFPGKFEWLTVHQPDSSIWTNDPANTRISFNAEGQAQIEADFDGPGAKIVFFGVE